MSDVNLLMKLEPKIFILVELKRMMAELKLNNLNINSCKAPSFEQ